MKARILYVEDDADLSFVTRDNLEHHGHEVWWRDNGRAALDLFEQQAFDLCILDVMLPEMDGFELAEAIRKKNQEIPILFLTAKSLPEDRLLGLRIGADDYLTKPFHLEELLLKIEIFFRRRKIALEPVVLRTTAIGHFSLDYPNLLLSYPGQEERRLTQREADLIMLLWQRKNTVVRRSEILEIIWGKDDYFLGRSLDVFVSRLRKYLKADARIRIENVHGIGFMFCCPP